MCLEIRPKYESEPHTARGESSEQCIHEDVGEKPLWRHGMREGEMTPADLKFTLIVWDCIQSLLSDEARRKGVLPSERIMVSEVWNSGACSRTRRIQILLWGFKLWYYTSSLRDVSSNVMTSYRIKYSYIPYPMIHAAMSAMTPTVALKEELTLQNHSFDVDSVCVLFSDVVREWVWAIGKYESIKFRNRHSAYSIAPLRLGDLWESHP